MAEDKHIHDTHPRDNPTVPSFVAVPWKSTRYHQQQISHDNSARPKETWPEVVGLTIEEAANIVKHEKPGAEIEIVYPGFLVMQNLDPRRVKLCVDFSGTKVQETPIVG